MSSTRIALVLAGQVAVGSTRHDRGLGPHAPRLQGRPVVPRDPRRQLLRAAAGRRAGRAAELPDATSLRITTGCAVRATGELVASQGKGQAVEIRADSDRGRRLGRRSRDTTRCSRSATRWSTCARSRTCGRARTRSARSRACATRSRRRSTGSSTSAASSGSTRRSSRRRDAEGAGADVPGVDARLREPAAHARRQGRLRQGLLRQARRA